MPIFCNHPVHRISQSEFRDLDYRVTGHVFAVHNALGRFCDESVYHEDLATRLRDDGLLGVQSKPAILLTHDGFQKELFPDLLVMLSAIYELKTVASLTGDHQKQLLTYLLLLELFHGKLLNFREDSIGHFFVSTSLDHGEQRRFSVEQPIWLPVSGACASWRERLLALLADWGAFLELSLYQEALVWFFGGAEQVIGSIEIIRDDKPIAKQRAHLLDPLVAFKVTAFTEGEASTEVHLRRFLAHTRLKAIQWVNFNRHTIQFKTLIR